MSHINAGSQQLTGDAAQVDGVKTGEQRASSEREDAVSIFQTPGLSCELNSKSSLQNRA